MKCKTLWGKKLLKEVRKKKSRLQEDTADRLVPNKWICLKTLWIQEKNVPFVSKPTVCLYPNCCLHGWTYVFWTRIEAESALCYNSLLCIHLPFSHFGHMQTVVMPNTYDLKDCSAVYASVIIYYCWNQLKCNTRLTSLMCALDSLPLALLNHTEYNLHYFAQQADTTFVIDCTQF